MNILDRYIHDHPKLEGFSLVRDYKDIAKNKDDCLKENDYLWYLVGNSDFLGKILLNAPFPGCHRHRVDSMCILCIPSDIHISIPHCVLSGYNMNKINKAAFSWLLGRSIKG